MSHYRNICDMCESQNENCKHFAPLAEVEEQQKINTVIIECDDFKQE